MSTTERLRSPSALTAAPPAVKPQPGEFAPLIGGRRVSAGRGTIVRSPYDREPVAVVDRAGPDGLESALGLQAGVFTNELAVVDAAFERIETGALIVNDVPTFRVDHMPYGGVKQSGFGREGLRYAIEEMTELKLLVSNTSATKR